MPPNRPRRRLGFREVLVFSLPLIALGLYLFGSAVLDYHRIRQFDDWWASATSIRKFGWYRARAALNAPRASGIAQRLDPDDPTKNALELEVDMAAWDRVARDVAGRWGEWIQAAIVDGGDRHRARVRFRGDGSVHWTGPKKSLTVRTRRAEQYQGRRELILSTKDVLAQYVVNALGNAPGMLAPDTRLTPVYLNRRFHGLFREVEPVDETFLRRRSRMPGNVWRGDTAERGEYFKDVPRELFANPYLWDRVARNDRPGVEGTQAILDFVALVNGTTFEQHRQLWERLDRQELARLLALLLVAGDPYHMSGVHNQLWYEDPTSGTLHPIVWDLRLLELGHPPPHSNVNRFWHAALRDPRLWHETMRCVKQALEPGGLFDRARELAREAEARFADELDYERLRDGVISPVGSADEIVRVLDHNADALAGWVADARAAWRAQELRPGTIQLDVVVDGRAAVRLAALELELDPLRRSELVLRVLPLRESAPFGEERPLAGGVVAEGASAYWRADQPLVLLPGCAGRGPELEPEAIAYRFTISGPDGGPAPVSGVRPLFESDLGGERVDAGELEARAPLPEPTSWHPWRFAEPAGRAVLLSGDVQLSEDLVLGARDTLAIEPGTRLRLDPDVSILSRGQVLAVGSAERPIVLEATRPGSPWGAFALQGPDTRGSRFEHVRFTGGGGALLDGVEYKGMVSVHNAVEVRFEHCELADNLRCDDALNVVTSQVELADCAFRNANADAIDFDLSGGLVERCLIEDAGNDGLDLMTSDPRVLACTIRRCGDKGVSVGEASRPLILDTTIEGCLTGVEPKDRSEPWIVRSTITGCETGIHQYAKNWRYDGSGWARLVGATVTGNRVDYGGEDGALLTTLGSAIGSVAPGSGLAPFDQRGTEVGWMLAIRDLEPVPEREGRPMPIAWRWPSTPRGLDGAAYEDERGDPSGGWTAGGGVLNQRLRRSGLTARIVDRDGRLERPVDWDLREGPRHLLVLEVAGEGVSKLVVTAHTADGVVGGMETLDREPGHFRWTSLTLPPGRYEALVLEPLLAEHAGRFVLRSWRLFELPPAAEDS